LKQKATIKIPLFFPGKEKLQNLIIFAAHINQWQSLGVDMNRKGDGPAAHLAVLDVRLPRHGNIDKHGELFTAVGTKNTRILQWILLILNRINA